MIHFFSEDVDIPNVIDSKIHSWIEKVIKSYNCVAGDINYQLCSDEHMLKINKQFLDHDYYTDIITFDYCNGDIISADIVISLDTVSSNSQQFNTNFENELFRVIIHGILHLIGFKDSTDAEKAEMRAQEDKALLLLSTFH